MQKFIKQTVVAMAVCALAATLPACEDTPPKPTQPAMGNDAISSTGTMQLNGEIISTPSPVLIVNLLQKNNVPYNAAMTNPVASKDKYVNETKKALNLGLYGADLAYTASFNAGQASNDYLDAVVGLSNSLGILEKIDKNLVSSLSAHINNRDSVLRKSAEFFKLGDRYLRANEQGHISSYILIGGWVEGLHLASEAAKANKPIADRIGEQKYAAPSITKLASQLNDQAFGLVKEELNALCDMLTELESTYKVATSVNDRETKTTYLRSKTSVVISAEQLAEITMQVEKVRNLITE
ncbi:MAG: hypothetical protein ACKVOR_02580 [Flavobacteriales bacterium]